MGNVHNMATSKNRQIAICSKVIHSLCFETPNGDGNLAICDLNVRNSSKGEFPCQDKTEKMFHNLSA